MKYYPKIRSTRKVDQAAYGSDYGFFQVLNIAFKTTNSELPST
jgi:hypothetical protein